MLGFDFCISVEYKKKENLLFFGKYQIRVYFISCGENISIFTRATHSWKYWFFHRTRWNIFGIHIKKVNILYIFWHRINTVYPYPVCQKKSSSYALPICKTIWLFYFLFPVSRAMTFESFCEALITIGLKYHLIKFVHNKNLLGWYTDNLLYTDGQKKGYSIILSG